MTVKKKITWSEWLFRSANLLLVLLTLLIYLTPFIDPHYIWWFGVLGLAFPLVFGANMASLLWWISKKRWRVATLNLACILLGWSYFESIVGINSPHSNPDQIKPNLKILTYNTRLFAPPAGTSETTLTTAQKALAVYQNEQPDLYCGQEIRYPAATKQLTELIRQSLDDPQNIVSKNGLVIVSKFPIVNRGSVPVGDAGSSFERTTSLFADVQISKNLIFRIYNLHLSSNKISGTVETLSTDDLKHKSSLQKLVNAVRNFRNTQKIRAIEAQIIHEHIAGSPYPVIVCGDFNDTPISFTYRKLTQGLQDNFCKRGRGVGSTYAGKLPLLRIDYVLTDPRFQVLSYKILKSQKNSDHYPVVSTITF